MNTQIRRQLPTLTVATLALTMAVGGTPTTASASDACARTPKLLSSAPVSQFKLPGGATAKIWDTGTRTDQMSEARLAAVTIPRSTLTPRVIAASTLTTASTPKSMVSSDAKTVVAMNGAVFDESWLYPEDSQMLGGTFRKGTSVDTPALAVYGSTKTVSVVRESLTGKVTSAHGTIPIGAVNWQSLSGSGVTAYTSAWGNLDHPVGRFAVVVAKGKVTEILSAWDGEARPATGETYLTARRGSKPAAALAKLRVGETVSVTTAPQGKILYGPKPAAIGKPTGLMGFSSMLLVNGVNSAVCSDRNEMLRPRSAVGWKANGDLIVATVSGRATRDGIRFGGATVHQWADYLKKLGAVNAAIVDGGNSTTLLVRKKVGGPLLRLDRTSTSDYQRPVGDGIAFSA